MKSLSQTMNEAFAQVPDTLIDYLSIITADYFVLAQNIRGLHWNLVDKNFHELHEELGDLYEQFSASIDVFAERLRQLSELPPSTVSEMLSMSEINEIITDEIDSDYVYDYLLTEFDKLQDTLRTAQKMAAEIDESSNNILSEHLKMIEKQIWLYKSNVE